MKQLCFNLLMAVSVTGMSSAAVVQGIVDFESPSTGTLGTDSVATWEHIESGFNGTDASFDLVITANAGAHTLETAGSGASLGVVSNSANAFFDEAGEAITFTISLASFDAGTSGYTAANVDFGMFSLTYGGAGNAADSGVFSQINGTAPDLLGGTSAPLIWADINGGSDFTGMGGSTSDTDFELRAMNDAYNGGAGERVTSFKTDWVGSTWSVALITVEYDFQMVPEPGAYALLGGLLALSYVMVRRRR